jgi:hypothetical protein
MTPAPVRVQPLHLGGAPSTSQLRPLDLPRSMEAVIASLRYATC